MCNNFTIISGNVPDCFIVNEDTLIQTPLNQQVQLQLVDAQITVQGTSIIQSHDSTQTIISLEGTAIVTIPQTVTTIRAGQQVTIEINQQLSDVISYNPASLLPIPMTQLQRPLEIIQPTGTPPATTTPNVDCPAPANWTDNYTVQSGDTLTTIADKANITVQDLQTANCIDNANSIRVGLVLRVPANAIAPTQPAQTFTPSAVFFRADNETILAGDCTILRWDVQNIRQIELDGNLITVATDEQVCPTETTTYTLTVTYPDATQSQHQVIITVNQS